MAARSGGFRYGTSLSWPGWLLVGLGVSACGANDAATGDDTSSGGHQSRGGSSSGGTASTSGGSETNATGGLTSTSGGSSGNDTGSGGAPVLVPDCPDSGSCGLDDPAFCDTFETAAPGGRGGDLDETLWSVARVGQKVNPSQGERLGWPTTTVSACGQVTEGVLPNQEIITCTNPVTGRTALTSSFDDAGGPAFQSLRVLQPFDFEGRVGRVSVDIDAKTRTPEGHGFWWEIVIADEAVPVPYQAFISHELMARRAVVFDFEGISSFDGTTNELAHVFVEDGYSYLHEFNRDQLKYEAFKTNEEVLNHIEIMISQDSLEVWATDLDDMSTFRKVASVDGLGLTFTRGYVNIQHSQYNASKAGLDGFVTYHIGSLGFDGPSLPRARSYQVPDAMTPGNGENFTNLGYQLDDGSGSSDASTNSFTFDDVDPADAVEARINLDAWFFNEARSIDFRFNEGEWKTFAHPYPESRDQTRAVTIPVDLADLAAGPNVLEMRTTDTSPQPPMVIANVELEVVPK